jgi:hypothetical protein
MTLTFQSHTRMENLNTLDWNKVAQEHAPYEVRAGLASITTSRVSIFTILRFNTAQIMFGRLAASGRRNFVRVISCSINSSSERARTDRARASHLIAGRKLPFGRRCRKSGIHFQLDLCFGTRQGPIFGKWAAEWYGFLLISHDSDFRLTQRVCRAVRVHHVPPSTGAVLSRT